MSDPNKSPFPAGFERDAKTLYLGYEMKILNKATVLHNLERIGVVMVPDVPPERVMAPPPLQRPTLEPEPVLFPIEGDPDHVVDVETMAVYNVHTGQHVGFFQEDAEPDIPQVQVEGPEEELLLSDAESPGIIIPEDDIDPELERPFPEDDVQVDGGEPS